MGVYNCFGRCRDRELLVHKLNVLLDPSSNSAHVVKVFLVLTIEAKKYGQT